MYYSYPCPVCGSVFFTFAERQEDASQTLYNAVESHMKNYSELTNNNDSLDHEGKEFEDLNTVYNGMSTSTDKPSGGSEV